MTTKQNLFWAVLVLTGSTLQAEVRLPSLFGDHMVLQRNQRNPIWGWASPRFRSRNRWLKRCVATPTGKSISPPKGFPNSVGLSLRFTVGSTTSRPIPRMSSLDPARRN